MKSSLIGAKFMKLNKIICFTFAGAMTMIVLYSSSAQMRAIGNLAPKAAESATSPYVELLYKKYGYSDLSGDKTFDQNSFAWRHESLKGDDSPYQQSRLSIDRQVDSAISSGKSPQLITAEYEAEAQKNSKSSLAQFRWGYALWKTITPTSPLAETRMNTLAIFFALVHAESPNTYNYARLIYLVSPNSRDETMLGERVLLHDPNDADIKAALAIDYTAPGSEPYDLKAKSRAIELSKELIQSKPHHANYYAILAEAYTVNYFGNGHHRQDGLATIAALKKYLSLAGPDEYFYQGAKARLFDMEQRVKKN